MKKTFAVLFLSAAVALPSVQALASQDGRMAGDHAPVGAFTSAPTHTGFTPGERQAVYDYFGMPLAQRNIREEVREKSITGPGAVAGARLSSSVPRTDIPVRLARKLNPPKSGTKHVAIDTDLVLLDLNTLQIIDVVPNVIPQYTR